MMTVAITIAVMTDMAATAIDRMTGGAGSYSRAAFLWPDGIGTAKRAA